VSASNTVASNLRRSRNQHRKGVRMCAGSRLHRTSHPSFRRSTAMLSSTSAPAIDAATSVVLSLHSQRIRSAVCENRGRIFMFEVNDLHYCAHGGATRRAGRWRPPFAAQLARRASEQFC
jgi:hypothetical protein